VLHRSLVVGLNTAAHTQRKKDSHTVASVAGTTHSLQLDANALPRRFAAVVTGAETTAASCVNATSSSASNIWYVARDTGL